MPEIFEPDGGGVGSGGEGAADQTVFEHDSTAIDAPDLSLVRLRVQEPVGVGLEPVREDHEQSQCRQQTG